MNMESNQKSEQWYALECKENIGYVAGCSIHLAIQTLPKPPSHWETGGIGWLSMFGAQNQTDPKSQVPNRIHAQEITVSWITIWIYGSYGNCDYLLW